MTNRLIRGLALGGCLLGSSAFSGCPNKPEEPDPVAHKASDAATPTASPSPSPSPTPIASAPTPASGDAGIELPFSPKEKRDLRQKINNELCEQAAKHLNVINGRPEFDKKGTLIITSCLFTGNVAWYKCVVDTSKPAEFEWCNARYLRSVDEIP